MEHKTIYKLENPSNDSQAQNPRNDERNKEVDANTNNGIIDQNLTENKNKGCGQSQSTVKSPPPLYSCEQLGSATKFDNYGPIPQFSAEYSGQLQQTEEESYLQESPPNLKVEHILQEVSFNIKLIAVNMILNEQDRPTKVPNDNLNNYREADVSENEKGIHDEESDEDGYDQEVKSVFKDAEVFDIQRDEDSSFIDINDSGDDEVFHKECHLRKTLLREFHLHEKSWLLYGNLHLYQTDYHELLQPEIEIVQKKYLEEHRQMKVRQNVNETASRIGQGSEQVDGNWVLDQSRILKIEESQSSTETQSEETVRSEQEDPNEFENIENQTEKHAILVLIQEEKQKFLPLNTESTDQLIQNDQSSAIPSVLTVNEQPMHLKIDCSILQSQNSCNIYPHSSFQDQTTPIQEEQIKPSQEISSLKYQIIDTKSTSQENQLQDYVSISTNDQIKTEEEDFTDSSTLTGGNQVDKRILLQLISISNDSAFGQFDQESDMGQSPNQSPDNYQNDYPNGSLGSRSYQGGDNSSEHNQPNEEAPDIYGNYVNQSPVLDQFQSSQSEVDFCPKPTKYPFRDLRQYWENRLKQSNRKRKKTQQYSFELPADQYSLQRHLISRRSKTPSIIDQHPYLQDYPCFGFFIERTFISSKNFQIQSLLNYLDLLQTGSTLKRKRIHQIEKHFILEEQNVVSHEQDLLYTKKLSLSNVPQIRINDSYKRPYKLMQSLAIALSDRAPSFFRTKLLMEQMQERGKQIIFEEIRKYHDQKWPHELIQVKNNQKFFEELEKELLVHKLNCFLIEKEQTDSQRPPLRRLRDIFFSLAQVLNDDLNSSALQNLMMRFGVLGTIDQICKGSPNQTGIIDKYTNMHLKLQHSPN